MRVCTELEEFGVEVTIAEDFAALESIDVAIIVNPNNPDGRRVPTTDLHALAATLRHRGCLLIADEAFADYLEPGAAQFRGCPRGYARVAILRQGLAACRGSGSALPCAKTSR